MRRPVVAELTARSLVRDTDRLVRPGSRRGRPRRSWLPRARTRAAAHRAGHRRCSRPRPAGAPAKASDQADRAAQRERATEPVEEGLCRDDGQRHEVHARRRRRPTPPPRPACPAGRRATGPRPRWRPPRRPRRANSPGRSHVRPDAAPGLRGSPASPYGDQDDHEGDDPEPPNDDADAGRQWSGVDQDE